MKKLIRFTESPAAILTLAILATTGLRASEPAPKILRFSTEYMDKSVAPGTDFFRYADGTWVKNNPVPPDKSRWAAFIELQERNWFLIHEILESTTSGRPQPNSPALKVGDFFRSSMDTNRLEQLGFRPLEADLHRVDTVKSTEELTRLLADFHGRGIAACFAASAPPDPKNSAVYTFSIGQGGLGLPDRDYYLNDSFAKQRKAYGGHVERMFSLLGEEPASAKAHAATVLELETGLAKASKARADLRDPIANYHKFAVADLARDYPDLKVYLAAAGLEKMPDLVVRQPEFFTALEKLAQERPLEDWKIYLRWHLLRATAPLLHAAAENEAFAFYGRMLRDQ